MLGKRLKQLRGKRTQQEIADLLDIARARYSHYENDHVQPDTDMLQRMASLYNVSVDYLLGRTDDKNLNMSPHAKLIVDSLDLSDDEIVKKFGFEVDGRRLTEDQVKQIVSFVRFQRSQETQE